MSIRICEKNKLSCSNFEINHPYLLHGKVGAYIAKTKFDIDDEEILQAITWHTTGRPNMSLLEKIIFVADYIEPARNPTKSELLGLGLYRIAIAMAVYATLSV